MKTLKYYKDFKTNEVLVLPIDGSEDSKLCPTHIMISDEEGKLLNALKCRALEYPSVYDLIDGIVKDDQAQIQAYKNACLAVKAKYPKV